VQARTLQGMVLGHQDILDRDRLVKSAKADDLRLLGWTFRQYHDPATGNGPPPSLRSDERRLAVLCCYKGAAIRGDAEIIPDLIASVDKYGDNQKSEIRQTIVIAVEAALRGRTPRAIAWRTALADGFTRYRTSDIKMWKDNYLSELSVEDLSLFLELAAHTQKHHIASDLSIRLYGSDEDYEWLHVGITQIRMEGKQLVLRKIA